MPWKIAIYRESHLSIKNWNMQYFVRIFSSQWSRAKFEAQHKKEKGFCLLFNFVLLFPSPLLDLEKGNRTRIKKRNNRWMDKEVVVYISSVQFSHPVVSDSLRPHELHRSPWPSPTSGVYPNPYPLSQWCHPSISSSVVHFSSYPQSFPASRSFQKSQFFTPGIQSIGVSSSASVLPMNIQDWFPLG